MTVNGKRWAAAAQAVLAAFALVGPLSVATGEAAPAKPVPHHAPPRAQPRQPVKTADPIRTLVAALAINSVESGENLYAACQRANLKGLLWSLDPLESRLRLEKSEFETAAEFEARKRGVEDALRPVGGKSLIHCQYTDDNEDLSFSYDAETETFDAAFDPRLRADIDFKKIGSYVSHTRMGVKARVQAFIDVEYYVDMSAALARSATPCLKSPSYGNAHFSVRVARADAPRAKRDAYIAFLGRLEQPIFAKSQSAGDPTLDHPKDIHETDLTMYFAPTAIVVVLPGGQEIFRCDLAPPTG